MAQETLKLKNGEISIEPKANGLSIDMKTADGKEFTFPVPTTVMLYFYETIIGKKNSFGVKSRDGKYIMAVKHKLIQNQEQNQEEEQKKEENSKRVNPNEVVIFLVYDAKEKKDALASFSIVLRALATLKRMVKQSMNKIENLSLKYTDFLLVKTRDVLTFINENKQLVVDYSNRDEFKDRLIEFIISNKERENIFGMNFNKEEAEQVLLLLTHQH